jgi:DNA-binding response OmpR family regulator
MKQILIVEDEKKIVDIVKAYLDRDGYQTLVAFDGKSAIEIATSKNPDLIILDIMLPEVSGLDVCRTLRHQSQVPIIMLTARDDIADKIIGLELGADDYITKPFNPNELVSRVRAVLRRTQNVTEIKEEFKVADLLIDTRKRSVKRGEHRIDLTSTEFDLLKVLAENPGRVFSRMQLLNEIQGNTYEGYERTIDSHIKNLRKKLEKAKGDVKYITTIHGIGYKMEEL